MQVTPDPKTEVRSQRRFGPYLAPVPAETPPVASRVEQDEIDDLARAESPVVRARRGILKTVSAVVCLPFVLGMFWLFGAALLFAVEPKEDLGCVQGRILGFAYSARQMQRSTHFSKPYFVRIALPDGSETQLRNFPDLSTAPPASLAVASRMGRISGHIQRSIVPAGCPGVDRP